MGGNLTTKVMRSTMLCKLSLHKVLQYVCLLIHFLVCIIYIYKNPEIVTESPSSHCRLMTTCTAKTWS